MTEDRSPALRADAQLNRERILAAAHPAFREDPRVSLNAIARLAGVGPGTLYRHFPTREDLILAVYQQEIQSLSNAVHDLVAEHSPLEAFRLWFLRLAALIRIKHGLGDALQSVAAQDVVNESYPPVTAAINVLIKAGQDSGELRADLDPSDVLLMMGFLWRTGDTAAGEEQSRRVLELAIAGLR